MHLFVVAVNSKLKTVDRKVPTNVNDQVYMFLCNIESAECMYNSCESCPYYEDNLEKDVESSTDIDESDSFHKMW